MSFFDNITYLFININLNLNHRYKFHRKDESSMMTEGELYNVIGNLKEAGYTVVALTTDMGGGNTGFANKLGVSDYKPYFEGLNAIDGEKIHYLYDPVHVMKRIRDNLLDHGFYLPNGTFLEKAMFVKLLEAIGKSDVRIAHKLSEVESDTTEWCKRYV